VVAVTVAVLALVALAVPLLRGGRSRRSFGTSADRAAFAALHEASLAAPPLRSGLTAAGATRAVRHLRSLLGTAAVALTNGESLLAWDGAGEQLHAGAAVAHSRQTNASGRTEVLGPGVVLCREPDCPIRVAVVAPLTVEGRVVGSLAAYAQATSAGLVRATDEVARWVSTQLELAELESSRTRLMEAEVRALRAQISPHFIYNSLGAIASFVRTDPDRARDLLLEFADFTRYSFRQHGDFTTLSEELRSIERYLLLEQARFGDRLQVVLKIAPEVLNVRIPFLCLQPLVENAVRHGLEKRSGGGTISIEARDANRECEITVEDDGDGEDPERIRSVLAGSSGDSVGLANVDERLRNTFGDEYGLVVETAPGAGTRVLVRVPKFAPGIQS
jgi:two-component system LytT family sensor kinase